MKRCSVVFLVFASVSAAPDAALALGTVGQAVRVAEATPIYRKEFRLEEGRTYTFEARVAPMTGGDATIHLWHRGSWVPFRPSLREVARASICHNPWSAANACIRYTVPTRGGGWHTLIVRATRNDTPGHATILRDSLPVDDTHVNPVPFGGRRIFLEQSGRAEMEISTVLVPGGTPDTYLLLLSEERLVAMDDDSGVGLASHHRVGVDTAQLRAVVGVNSAVQIGAARLIANDWRWNDADRDGLGISLEGRALGTCRDHDAVLAATIWGGVDWRCNTIPDPADTDEDGIRDDAEVFGIFERRTEPAVLLPRWGSDPRHKDVFVEADWCASARAPNCNPLDPDPDESRIRQDKAADAARAYAELRADSIANPDGRPGVALHIDTGYDEAACGTTCGAWGGATCVPRQPDNTCLHFEAAYDAGNMAPNRRGVFHYAFLPGGESRINQVIFAAKNHAYTIAHELGHNLNLHHSGDARIGVRDQINCKPHYPSLMNYAYAFVEPLRFSRGDLQHVRLNKRALVERDGIGTRDPAVLDQIAADRSHWRFRYDIDYSTQPDQPAAIDWNRDGVIQAGTVEAPLNWTGRICETFSIGAQSLYRYTPAGVSGTASPVWHNDVYYLFYPQHGRLYYQTATRAPEACLHPDPARGWQLHDSTPCADWSAPAEIGFATAGTPPDVSGVVAEPFWLRDGGDQVVVVYHAAQRGEFRWLTVGATGALGPIDRGVVASSVPGIGAADLDLEPHDGRLWLAYTDGAPPAEIWVTSMDADSQWTTPPVPARDEHGAVIVAGTGVGLARNAPADTELMMAVAQHDGGCNRLRLRSLTITTPGAWEDVRWADVGGFPDRLCTTTRPALAFRPSSTWLFDGAPHAQGGWYMVSYRPRHTRVWETSSWVRMTGTNRHVFATGIPPTELDKSSYLPPDPVMGVRWFTYQEPVTGWRGVLVGRRTRMLGAFPRYSAATLRQYLVFLPYADGIATTDARDVDDANAIRYGLCVSLQSVNPALRCDPPAPGPPPPEAKRYDPDCRLGGE